MPKLVFVAAVALINDTEEILLAQRPEGKAMAGLWEFPGGKVEAGESPEDALRRELREELGIEVNIAQLKPLTFASHSYEATSAHPAFHLFMPLYSCRQWEGEVVAHEHQALEWVSKARLPGYPMPEADLPLVAFIQSARF